MAPNEDARRHRDGPEDNPFIAFRRFADSQASWLLNSVITLPATIANFNNAHVAWEQCLFGRVDKSKCDELHELEDRIANLRSEGRELYRMGDLQAVLTKGEELMQLDRQADHLRKNIVESARGNSEKSNDRKQTELEEKVGNEKGQQWGWSWSWGFPRPLDDDDSSLDDKADHRSRCRRWRQRRDEARMNEAEEEWTRFNERWESLKKRTDEELCRAEGGQPKVWRWSFQWPPPADVPKRDASPNHELAQLQSIIDQMGKAIADEVPRIFDSPSYSPRALEENEELRRAGVQWRDAFEDLMRAEHGAPLMPPEPLGQSRNKWYNEWARRFHDPEFAREQFTHWVTHPNRAPWSAQPSNEEPIYEYGHDHEDQHDDPPTPKIKQDKSSDGMPETELDAYERLLGRAHAPGAPAQEEVRPSILSTLTTTERTVAPDGTVTTKVVLKKRFADGREESSETVHAQRGQEADAQLQDPWRAMQDAQNPSQQGQERPRKEGETKKSGWFWSS